MGGKRGGKRGHHGGASDKGEGNWGGKGSRERKVSPPMKLRNRETPSSPARREQRSGGGQEELGGAGQNSRTRRNTKIASEEGGGKEGKGLNAGDRGMEPEDA